MAEDDRDRGESVSELEFRRLRVQQLRLRRMTQDAIAAVIGVDQSTVSRDLQWIEELLAMAGRIGVAGRCGRPVLRHVQ